MATLLHMKSIKIKINLATYFFFLLSFLCGYFKNVLYIFLIVFIHELGHVIVIRAFKYKIVEVELYPFGGITKIDKPLNSSLTKEAIIGIAGITMQLILGLFLNLTHLKDYQLLSFYNKTILAFNLLPIIPLDGSVLFHTFLEKFFPYQKAYYGYQIFSILCFFLFLLYNIVYQVDNYFICAVLLYRVYITWKNRPYLFHRFYLERMLYSFPYKKIENHRVDDLRVLKKETRHFFYQNNHYVSERQKIKEYLYKNRKA